VCHLWTHIYDASDLVKTWVPLIHLIDEECTPPWCWDSSLHLKNGFVFRKEIWPECGMAWFLDGVRVTAKDPKSVCRMRKSFRIVSVVSYYETRVAFVTGGEPQDQHRRREREFRLELHFGSFDVW